MEARVGRQLGRQRPVFVEHVIEPQPIASAECFLLNFVIVGKFQGRAVNRMGAAAQLILFEVLETSIKFVALQRVVVLKAPIGAE